MTNTEVGPNGTKIIVGPFVTTNTEIPPVTTNNVDSSAKVKQVDPSVMTTNVDAIGIVPSMMTAAPGADGGPSGTRLLRTVSFNAKGFKQSHIYISKLLEDCDIIGLTETWLRPGELPMINETFKHKDLCIFSKSSMCDIDPSYMGRPFGGMAMICAQQPGLSFTEIETCSDRIMGVKICNNNGVAQIVFCVYMPFYSGDYGQVELYLEVLDELQSLVDQFGAMCPMYIIGDFNVQLPSKNVLHKSWYKSQGFNKNSRIMYDFISDNDLCLLDFINDQIVNYTYFCHTSGKYTWIDHCLGTKHVENFVSCSIIDHDEDNVSDHLPLRLVTQMTQDAVPECYLRHNQYQQHMQPRWDDRAKTSRYKDILCCKLKDIDLLPDDITSECLQNSVDSQLDLITKAMHESTQEAGCLPRKINRPKPYWNPELSRLRDRKRFWWHLWVQNDRPRSGTVYETYKWVKKEFRKMSRLSVNNTHRIQYDKLDNLLNAKRTTSFWNEIKRMKRTRVRSDLSPDDLKKFYESVMTDTGNRTQVQEDDKTKVQEYFIKCKDQFVLHDVQADTVSSLIDSLPGSKSPGIDGITTEHLKHGKTSELCQILANLYCIALSRGCVPSTFNTGVIVPILKKSSLNPNVAKNYRPVTLSSIHTKLVELLVLPNVNISSSQFGFREGRGTSMACNLLNDIISYSRQQGNPLFVASLDAEKCFDSVCHFSLFVKLIDILPSYKWLFLYNWYSKLNAIVKWQGQYSNGFNVTRGTRQGSVLSPCLFNIFINDLLNELSSLNVGINIGGRLYNSLAYADDITVFCSSIPGLQNLINVCTKYSERWRFKFNKDKSKCIIIGKNNFIHEPKWFVHGQSLENVSSMEILGNIFNNKGTCCNHVDGRIKRCRQSFYNLLPAGILYPGASPVVQAYLYKHVCQPSLTYGLDCMNVSDRDICKLDSTQGKLIKQSLGLSKRSHNSQVLQALGIKPISDIVSKNTKSLYYRICNTDSPSRSLLFHFLSQYILFGTLVQGSLLHTIVKQGISPIRSAFNSQKLYSNQHDDTDGHIESLKYLLQHENFMKPYSAEHYLVHLLTKAF